MNTLNIIKDFFVKNPQKLSDLVKNMLRLAGWQVYNKTPNTNNPSHILKFRLLNDIFEENNKILPFVRINEDNCPKLIVSIENAGLKQKKTLLKKTKALSGQKKAQEHATHLSDCFDYLLWWKYAYLLDNSYRDSFIISSI